MNDLVVFEKQLQPLIPRFEQVLARIMPVERLVASLMISLERTPKLLDCDRQSLLNAAMTFAVLGLELDGVTGQGFLLPFKIKGRGVVQPCIGYKGYNTLGARANMTITGEVVREGDGFDPDTDLGLARHKPILDNKGRIVAAWARAASLTRPAILTVLGRGDIDAVMNRSPAVRFEADTPWRDPVIGFPAMAGKTAKRRLARSLPLTVFQYAARMEEVFEEQGRPSWISPDRGVMIEGTAPPLTTIEPSETPTAEQLIPSLSQAPKPPGTPEPATGQPAPEGPNPPAGAGEAAAIARLKAQIAQLATRTAHENWARANDSAILALSTKGQHEVTDFYYRHKG